MSNNVHEANNRHINRYKMAHMIGVAEYMRERACDYGLDPNVMYTLGLLHDIGYLEGQAAHEKTGADILAKLGANEEAITAIANHGKNPYDIKTDEISPMFVLLLEADMSVDTRGYRVGFKGRTQDMIRRFGEGSEAHYMVLDNIKFIKDWQKEHGIGKPIRLYHDRKEKDYGVYGSSVDR